MKKNLWAKLGVVLIIGGFLVVSACAKKTVLSTSASEEPALNESGASEEDLARQREEELARQRVLGDDAMSGKGAGGRDMFVSEDIHFDYDQSSLRADAQEILKRKAEWLSSDTNVSVVIEGHCDERGSGEYNLALGDRRAESAKTFLVNMGVSSSRISTISYGEEKPIDRGRTEAAWSKNRRAHFTIN